MRAAEIMRKLMDVLDTDDQTVPSSNVANPTSQPKTPTTATPPTTGDISFGKGRMKVATGSDSNISLGKGPNSNLPTGAYMNFGKPTDTGQLSVGVGKGAPKGVAGAPSDTRFSVNFNKRF